MDIEDDDDFYAPEEPQVAPAEAKDKDKDKEKPTQTSDDLEEGEEEDEGAAMDEDDDSDSDIDIITERKDGTTAAPPPQSKYSDIRNIPQRSTSNDAVTAAPVVKTTDSKSHNTALGVPIADKTSAAASKSTIDINANPVYAPAGKPITQVSIDEDLPENEKPWRKPGTDISDYFNYGFDEFTWALYAAKQDSVRGEYSADAFAANNKKMMDDFNMMMMGGGMGGGGAGGGGGMMGMEGMTPEMQQQMMQQMMQAGMDPSQMDPNQMAAMMSAMQGGQGGQGQNFGGGYGGNQGGFGFDQNMGGGGGGGGGGGQGGGRGGFGGRGRGRRWQ